MWRRALPCALLLVLSLAGAGPGGAATAEVVIDTALSPAELTVPVGTAVTWRNAHGQRHRVRTTSAPVEIDSGNMDPGAVFTMTLEIPGTYRYVDDRDRENAGYWGTINVAGSPQGPQPPPPPGGSGTPPGPGAPARSAPAPSAPAPSAPAPSAPAPSSASVSIADRAFSPPTVRIAAGGTASWANGDDRPHTVTARDASFDSGIVSPGQGFTRAFAGPGTFPYFCAVHPEMTGTVEVVDASGTAPPPAPPAPAGGGIPGGGPAAGAAGGDAAAGAGSAAPAAPAGGSTTAARAGAAGAAAPTSASVGVVDFAFQPSTVTVAVSGTVSWANRGVAPHTVTAADASFDSGILAAGRSFSFRFPRAGTFSYRCSLHPQMQGTVVVSQADGPEPASGLAEGTTPADGVTHGNGTEMPQEGGGSPSRSGSASGPGRSPGGDALAGTSRQTSGRWAPLVMTAAMIAAFTAGTALAPRVRRLRRLLPARLRRC